MKRYLIKKIFHEPLVIFLLIAAVLYMINIWFIASTNSVDERIIISTDQVKQLSVQFSRTWMRLPTESELDGLIQNHVRDEVYYREALRLGLDENDLVIRRRLRQKLETLLDDMSTANVPSDQVLLTFMQENADRFRIEPQVSFKQVYLNPDERKDLEQDAKRMIARLQSGARPEDTGDPTLVGYEFEQVTQSEVERQFGADFASQLLAVDTGIWSGPLYSGLGGHLVKVTEHVQGRMPQLSEIRAVVEREWLTMRREELKDAAYNQLLQGYQVVIGVKETEVEE